MKARCIRFRTACVSLLLLVMMGLSGLYAASLYMTNMPSKDTTLTGDNKNITRMIEPHVLENWAKKQSIKPIVVDAGYFANGTTTAQVTNLLKSNQYLTMAVLPDNRIGMLNNGTLRLSKTVSFTVDKIPVTCFVLESGDTATKLQMELYGNGSVGTRFTIGFCDEGPNEARQLLQSMNARQQVIDMLVCRGSSDATATVPVGSATLVVMAWPSPTMLKLDVSVDPYKVKIGSLSQEQLQNF